MTVSWILYLILVTQFNKIITNQTEGRRVRKELTEKLKKHTWEQKTPEAQFALKKGRIKWWFHNEVPIRDEENFYEKQLFIINKMKLKPQLLRLEIKAVRLINHKKAAVGFVSLATLNRLNAPLKYNSNTSWNISKFREVVCLVQMDTKDSSGPRTPCKFTIKTANPERMSSFFLPQPNY